MTEIPFHQVPIGPGKFPSSGASIRGKITYQATVWCAHVDCQNWEELGTGLLEDQVRSLRRHTLDIALEKGWQFQSGGWICSQHEV